MTMTKTPKRTTPVKVRERENMTEINTRKYDDLNKSGHNECNSSEGEREGKDWLSSPEVDQQHLTISS